MINSFISASILWFSIGAICFYILSLRVKFLKKENLTLQRQVKNVASDNSLLECDLKLKNVLVRVYKVRRSSFANQKRRLLNDLSALKTEHESEIEKWKRANGEMFSQLNNLKTDLERQACLILTLTEKNSELLGQIMTQDIMIEDLRQQLEQFEIIRNERDRFKREYSRVNSDNMALRLRFQNC